MRRTGNRTEHWGPVETAVHLKPFVDQSSLYEVVGTHCTISVFAWSSMSCFIQKIFAIKSSKNQRNVKVLAPNFFGRTDPHFSTADCYRGLLSTVWQSLVELSSVWWSPSVKPGDEVECRIYGWWVKWRSNFKAFDDESSWHFDTM